jgi:hypothetical protein
MMAFRGAMFALMVVLTIFNLCMCYVNAQRGNAGAATWNAFGVGLSTLAATINMFHILGAT